MFFATVAAEKGWGDSHEFPNGEDVDQNMTIHGGIADGKTDKYTSGDANIPAGVVFYGSSTETQHIIELVRPMEPEEMSFMKVSLKALKEGNGDAKIQIWTMTPELEMLKEQTLTKTETEYTFDESVIGGFNGPMLLKVVTSDSNNPVRISQVYMKAEHLRPTAEWKVEIRSSLGDLIETQSVEDGKCAVEPEAPTKEGYQFDGWYTIDREKKQHSFTFDTPITDDITIYAKMTKLHKVTFMDEGEVYKTLEVADGYCAKEPVDPVKEGYQFDGWYVNPDGEGGRFDFENTPITEDTTLYARWEKEEPPEIRHDVSFLVDGELYCYESVPEGGQVSPPTVDPTKEGYEFTGWYLNKDGKGTAFDFDTPITKDTTLYAGWVAKDNPNPNPNPSDNNKTGKTTKGGIKTGDNNMAILFAGLGAVAIGTALVMGLRRKENK